MPTSTPFASRRPAGCIRYPTRTPTPCLDSAIDHHSLSKLRRLVDSCISIGKMSVCRTLITTGRRHSWALTGVRWGSRSPKPEVVLSSLENPIAASGLPTSQPYLVLGIETSCDDTAVAVMRSNGEILSNVVLSQVWCIVKISLTFYSFRW